jgi:4-hydroxy-tetrahydrodipicolinate reductase
MSEPVTVGVVGLGRLGRAILDRCAEQGHPVVLTASARTGWRIDAVPDVLVDASAPGATDEVRGYCLRHRLPLVECVSNLDGTQWTLLGELARHVPVVRATNLAVGHYAQSRMVQCLAALGLPAALAPVTSVFEQHPRSKAHRPSATAVELARVWAAGAGADVDSVCSQRAGLPVSEHEIMWTWEAEMVSLRHSVRSPAAAAGGALAAVRWVSGRGPGLADMRAVFDDLVRATASRGAGT